MSAARIAAALMLVLWIGMITAPLVFGAPECMCPDCRGQFCVMKQHHSATGQAAPPRVSCHHQSGIKGECFRKAPCHHEVTMFMFSYNAVLQDARFTARAPVTLLPETSTHHLVLAGALPETPPPRQPSA